jgi:two-component system, NarL family, response regulator DegU
MNNIQGTALSEKINVMVLASHNLAHSCLRLLLESADEVRVMDEAKTASDLVRKASRNKPDVVLLCVMENQNEHIEVIPELFRVAPNARVVILSSPNGLEDQMKALKLGAAGIIGMNQNSRMLIRAIKQVYQGDTWFSQKLVARVLGNRSSPGNGSDGRFVKTDELTNRELEVIKMIGLGLKNREISERLFISEATVRHHLSSVYGKLRVDDRLNLVIYAYQHGLVNLSQR